MISFLRQKIAPHARLLSISLAMGMLTTQAYNSNAGRSASPHIQKEIRFYLSNLGVSNDRANMLPICCFSPSKYVRPIGLTTGSGIWIDEEQLADYPVCLCSFYLAHEAAHYALGHYRGFNHVDQEKAADIAAAHMLCKCGRRSVVEQYAAYLKNTIIPQEGAQARVDTQHPTFRDEVACLEKVLAK